MIYPRRKRHCNVAGLWFCVIAIMVLVGTGVVYRGVAGHLQSTISSPITLPVPLKFFPFEAHGWKGEDVPIPEIIQLAARNDDYLNRMYVKKKTRQWANVYIAYSARPRTMMGHRPQVCYPASGWIHQETEHIQIRTISGREISCLMHRFNRPAPHYDKIVVINYYVLNGQVTDDESGFSGIDFRSPNISGDPARYVAQIQVASVLEDSVRSAIRDLSDRILEYFPDEEGRFKTTEDPSSI